MFERYDEPARRALFFARYEASLLGSTSIESEHLLLGLLREPRGPVSSMLIGLSLAEIRKDLESGVSFQERLPTSVEIPFSRSTKRVLGLAAEEADRLEHQHIGTEHLLLGLLREAESLAATTLDKHGLSLEAAREKARAQSAPSRVTTNPEARAQIMAILDLVDGLGRTLGDNADALLMLDVLRTDLERLRAMFRDS